jgi:hypothetical protein
MGAAVPILLGISAASQAKGAVDARKGQKEQIAQQERIAAETRANTPQGEREATDLFSKRRARRTPGFSDVGATSGGTEGAYLGQ